MMKFNDPQIINLFDITTHNLIKKLHQELYNT